MENNNDHEPKSKSQLKREMLALQALGEQLVKLSTQQLTHIPLDPHLLTAIRDAQAITSHNAHRRQLQYIGRLMREIDVEPVQDALAALQQHSQQATAAHHRLEHWRERLISEGDKALTEFLIDFPKADSQLLRQFIRKAQLELQQGKPPETARKLFRYLRSLQDPHPEHSPPS